ncbi:MAG TPA: thioredoxin domain-containing protein [Thermodesulfobacteriota bacterium]|nr:thioredoxin domain-containing protein [Thermodesulfobacteriota bacterium]
MRRIHFAVLVLAMPCLLVKPILAQEDKIVQIAIETFKAQMRIPPGTNIKFAEKKEGPISAFYSVKLILSTIDKEIPVVVYVDKSGEKVFLGNLFVKGENVTAKEAGPPRTRKIDMRSLDIDKSPSIGPKEAKVTIVEFSNFNCPYCAASWMQLKKLIEKDSKDIRYVFKHFPLQSEGKTFELSEMAAAARELSDEAFWFVHDFFFSTEGQALERGEMGPLKQKIEQILKEKGYNLRTFKNSLESGSAKLKVRDDLALGNKLRVTSTPTKVVNGDIIIGSTADNVLEQYFTK